MSFFPLTEILIYLALFFAPPNTTQIALQTPDGTLQLARENSAWTEGSISLAIDGNDLVRSENAKKTRITIAPFLGEVRSHDWTKSYKAPLQLLTTLEKIPDGWIARTNDDGSKANRAFHIHYILASKTSQSPHPLTINVLGAVKKPGAYPLPPGSTLLDALAASGGTTASADVHKISVLIGPAGDNAAVFSHDATLIAASRTTQPLLEDHNTVYVPELAP